MNTARVLVFINIVIFLAWHLSGNNESQFLFMAYNFLVSWTSITDGHFWTLITSVFSHKDFIHLFFNMYVLYSFGPIVESVLGRARFLKFYFIAGIISSLCHALVSAFILHQPSLPALGASGAISGMIFLFALMFPTQKILIFGIVPMPALWGALLFVGLDIWGVVAQAEGGGLPIGHGAHLGGALTGVIYYFFFLRPRRKPDIYNAA